MLLINSYCYCTELWTTNRDNMDSDQGIQSIIIFVQHTNDQFRKKKNSEKDMITL